MLTLEKKYCFFKKKTVKENSKNPQTSSLLSWESCMDNSQMLHIFTANVLVNLSEEATISYADNLLLYHCKLHFFSAVNTVL